MKRVILKKIVISTLNVSKKEIDRILKTINKKSIVDLRYDGIQKDAKGNIIYYQFTTISKDVKLNDITFGVEKPTYKNIEKRLNIFLKRFQER